MVVVAVLGCSNRGTPHQQMAPEDAPPMMLRDASVDAPLDAPGCAACGPITVTVYGDGVVGTAGQPAAGINVYFLGPNHYESQVITGADGVASVVAPDGTTAFVARKQSSTNWHLDAYEGLLVGDSIVDGTLPGPPTANTIVSTEYFTHPTYSDATAYYLRASCTSGDQRSSSPSVASAVMCSDFSSASAVVYATDSLGHLAYTSISGVDYATQQGAGNPIALPAFQAAGTMATNFTNLPTTGNNYLEVVSFTTAGSDFRHFFDSDLYGGGAGASQSVSGPFVPFGDATHVIATISRSGYGAIRYTQALAGGTLTVPIDAATMPHPVSASSYDASMDAIEWTSDATAGVSASTVSTGIAWQTSSAVSVSLSILAPASGSALAIPTLPSALAQLAYDPSQVVFGGVRLHTYVGKSFHDELVGQTGAAALWESFSP